MTLKIPRECVYSALSAAEPPTTLRLLLLRFGRAREKLRLVLLDDETHPSVFREPPGSLTDRVGSRVVVAV